VCRRDARFCRNAIHERALELECIAKDAIYFNEEETEGNKTEEIMIRWGKGREDEWTGSWGRVKLADNWKEGKSSGGKSVFRYCVMCSVHHVGTDTPAQNSHAMVV